MGIKATHSITRATALAVLHSKLNEASDSALENMLEEFPESHFRNYSILTQEEFDKELEQTNGPHFYIKSVCDF